MAGVEKTSVGEHAQLFRILEVMAMNDGQHHHSGLDAAKPLKRRDCGSHGEGCENIDGQDHQVKNLQIGLKHFVLEFPPEEWS